MRDYHHGNLRCALLDEAELMAEEANAEAITLRALARKTGVSHSAPVHHFATRQGLLSALSTRGFEQLLAAITKHPSDIYAMGVEYVSWALEHPGLYAVMWQPRLLDDTDSRLNDARKSTWDALTNALTTATQQSAAHEAERRIDAYAAFSIVHGLASLWINKALPLPESPAELAAQVTRRLCFASNSS